MEDSTAREVYKYQTDNTWVIICLLVWLPSAHRERVEERDEVN